MSRSQSRGREQEVYSSGRGGAGNIRPVSRDPVARPKGPDDFSPSRGRELPNIADKVTHSGRGGAGNVRSRSRDAAEERKYAAEVNQYAKEHTNPDAPVAHGRGGYGNIDRSRSRSREPNNAPAGYTYGHGGAGNVAAGAPNAYLGKLDEEEARQHHQEGNVHSSGRGGYGNVTPGHAPGAAVEDAEVHAHHQENRHYASGRGGAGNIH